jgi:hypothetical protein
VTRFFWFIADQGEPVNGGWRERGFAPTMLGNIHHALQVPD